MNRLLLAALIAAFIGSGCVAPVQVINLPTPPPPGELAHQATRDHRKLRNSDPKAATSRLLTAISEAQKGTLQGKAGAVDEYNYLVGRLVEMLAQSHLLEHGPIVLPSPCGPYTLDVANEATRAALHHPLFLADRIGFYGRHAYTAASRPGIGASIISSKALDDDLSLELSDYYRNFTAVLQLQQHHAELAFADPYEHETVRINHRELPLAANFSAATSLMLSHERLDRLGFARLIRPSHFDKTSRITAVQPYHPDRIPVLFVHGLQDTPSTWAPMYYGLIADPEIRRHYQFWTFSYPSGYPYPYSAAILRRELKKVTQQFPRHRDIVLIGHSMGGLISRIMITDAGEKIWIDNFGHPPAESKLRGRSAEVLKDTLVFDAHPHIGRTIYLATPHRGSELAKNWIGRLGSKLVKLPDTFADLRDEFLYFVTNDQAGQLLGRAPNSIDTLSPDSRFMQQINRLPTDPSVPFHSIIGDLGFGSDGVVATWSSHLDGAESEKLILASHFVHTHPEAIREVHRILLEHANLPPAPLILPTRNSIRRNILRGHGPISKR
ncbi:MAG: esterase/lipase family protein [Verrucomicrobiales bacterium]